MLRNPFFPLRWLWPLILGGLGCAAHQHVAYSPGCPPASQGVVFTVDGAGGFQGTSKALRKAAAEEHLPLCVETFPWSHGYGLGLADQIGYEHSREQGRRLAALVVARRCACPDKEIDLVGHSAGTAVVLAAAEALPPGSVDHIILLAPSVAASHDLRPALRCARKGVDVFYSSRDRLYLGVGVTLVGTADGRWTAAAGRSGFRPVIETPADAALYANLRQHPWNPSVEWTGNWGGHYGSHQAQYLHAYVLPILRPRAATTNPSTAVPDLPIMR
jgi:pimeloyl-ACP methyl ester carboxylesterase